MQISQSAANNRTHFSHLRSKQENYPKASLFNPNSHDLQLKLGVFCSEQSFEGQKNAASQQSTPWKNSGYSTHEDDSSFEQDFQEVCSDFSTHGACMRGGDCELHLSVREMDTKKDLVKTSMMRNFPELLGIGMGPRVRSFLA